MIKIARLGPCLLVKGIVPTNVLAGLELGVLLARKHTERVRAEVVTLQSTVLVSKCETRDDNMSAAHLRLEDVGGHDLAAVAVEERKSGREGGSRDTPEDGLRDDATPTRLRLVDGLVEEVVEEQRLEVAVLLVRSGDVAKEDRLDDATATPHARNARVVQVPVKLYTTTVSKRR